MASASAAFSYDWSCHLCQIIPYCARLIPCCQDPSRGTWLLVAGVANLVPGSSEGHAKHSHAMQVSEERSGRPERVQLAAKRKEAGPECRTLFDTLNHDHAKHQPGVVSLQVSEGLSACSFAAALGRDEAGAGAPLVAFRGQMAAIYLFDAALSAGAIL